MYHRKVYLNTNLILATNVTHLNLIKNESVKKSQFYKGKDYRYVMGMEMLVYLSHDFAEFSYLTSLTLDRFHDDFCPAFICRGLGELPHQVLVTLS